TLEASELLNRSSSAPCRLPIVVRSAWPKWPITASASICQVPTGSFPLFSGDCAYSFWVPAKRSMASKDILYIFFILLLKSVPCGKIVFIMFKDMLIRVPDIFERCPSVIFEIGGLVADVRAAGHSVNWVISISGHLGPCRM